METLKKIGGWIRTQGKKALVILKAAPTRLTVAAGAIAYFHENIVDILPEAWQGDAAELAVGALAAITAAVRIIRRVTEVAETERGVLPVDQPDPLPPGV